MPRRFSKKKRFIRRRRFVPRGVKRYVKRAISKRSETKFLLQSSVSGPSTAWGIVPLNEVAEGLTSNDRIGAKLTPLYFKLNGLITAHASSSAPTQVRILIYWSRRPSVVADLPTSLNLPTTSGYHFRVIYDKIHVVSTPAADRGAIAFSVKARLRGVSEFTGAASTTLSSGFLDMAVITSTALNGPSLGIDSVFYYKDS